MSVDIINEKLITFKNRSKYGNVLFVLGGGGSGKGFAINNFIDASNFKQFNPDDLKGAIIQLNKLGRLNIRSVLEKYSHRKDKIPNGWYDFIVKNTIDKNRDISDLDLKNTDDVSVLHFIVELMGLNDSKIHTFLKSLNNTKVLPNILFDRTGAKIEYTLKDLDLLLKSGYLPENIHIVWVLTDYKIALRRNRSRDRIVADDIIIATHIGAATSITSLFKSLPPQINGRIDVIFNNPEFTTVEKSKLGKSFTIKDFMYVPVKKQGAGFHNERQWKSKIFDYIKQNIPPSALPLISESINDFYQTNDILLPKNTLGVSRKNMPQVSEKSYKDFFVWLNDQNVDFNASKIRANKLKSTQREFYIPAIQKLVSNPSEKLNKTILVSKDNYVIDGHHRWLANLVLDFNKLLKVIVIDLPIKQALKIVHEFPDTYTKDIYNT